MTFNFLFFFYFQFSRKISLDISCESSAGQTIQMKCQDLLSMKKKQQLSSAAVVTGALIRVNPGPAEPGYTLPLETV